MQLIKIKFGVEIIQSGVPKQKTNRNIFDLLTLFEPKSQQLGKNTTA
jgi:hypothetical protein